MRLPRADALAGHPIGRHVLVYSLGAMCVQLVAQGRRVLEAANLLTPHDAALCPDCERNRVAQLDAEPLTPPAEGDPLTDSPAYDEEAPTPVPAFGVNGAGEVEPAMTEQPPAG